MFFPPSPCPTSVSADWDDASYWDLLNGREKDKKGIGILFTHIWGWNAQSLKL